jgi:hypothetical protein
MRTCPAAWLAAVVLAAACTGNPQPVPSRQAPVAPPSARPVLPEAGPIRPAPAQIGSDRPTLLIAASAAAHWVAHCEAREDSDGNGAISVSVGPHGALGGDRMQPSLTISDGRAFAIERVAAFDPTGRWVVVMLGGRLVLFDAINGARTDLSALHADARIDGAPYRDHRALAFAADGRAIAYVRRRAGSELVIVRELATGSETTIHPSGSVWRLGFDQAGSSLLLHQAERWPAPERETLSACIGPVAPIAAWTARGDPVTTAIAPRTGGMAQPAEGFVALLAAGLVVRDEDGRLLLRSGDETELAPASCGARVLHADARRNLLVVACAAARGRSPLELVGPGSRQPLDIDIAFLAHDHAAAASGRVVALYPSGAPALLDLDQRRMMRLRSGDSVVVTAGARAIVHRGDQLLVVDVESGSETPLEGTTRRLAAMLATESIGVVPPLVADAARARLIGTIDSEPLAVARDGRVLIALGGGADADRLAVGPLVWRTPTPIEATDTPQSASAARD